MAKKQQRVFVANVIDMVAVHNLLASFYCVLKKETLESLNGCIKYSGSDAFLPIRKKDKSKKLFFSVGLFLNALTYTV